VAQGLVQGCVLTLALLGLYAGLLALDWPADRARAALFVTLVTANAALILPSRLGSDKGRGLFSGLPRVTLWVMAGTLLALALVTTWPAVARGFRFAPLSAAQWLAAFGLGVAMLLPFQAVSRLLLRTR
jgi:Ca2+-transporting ATPase